MKAIKYVKGDATRPQGDGPKIIAHVCNSVGGWGAGFVLAVSKRWLGPERHYRQLKTYDLGASYFIKVEPELFVANMIAQSGYGNNNSNLHRSDEEDSRPPIRYDALRACLEQVAEKALEENATVHMPRIGCALAGGKWSLVEPIIQETISSEDIPVTVYDYGFFNP